VAVRAWSSVGMIFWISSYFVWVDVADGGGRKIKIGREMKMKGRVKPNLRPWWSAALRRQWMMGSSMVDGGGSWLWRGRN
jgi:hypothetical protein